MGRFIYPPHPASALKILPESVDKLDKEGGWVAQRKYNGSHAVIHVYRNEVSMWNREGEPFTTYTLTPKMKKCILDGLNIPYDVEVVLDGELLHTKAKSSITNSQSAKNTIVFYDLLYLGRPLLLEDFLDRYNLLVDLCRNPKTYEPKRRGLFINEYEGNQIWLAENFFDDFLYRFYEMYEFDEKGRDFYPEIEGLVCKKIKNSRLGVGNKPYDVDWMMRVRKTKDKVYMF